MHRADEIILHIGFAKTGTTAIQRFLLSQKSALLAQGVLWPTSDDNHYHLRSIISDDPASQIQIGRLGLSPDDTQQFLEKWRANFLTEIEKTKPQRIVLSTEYLNGAKPHEFGRLRDFLKPLCNRLRVLAYIRDPWTMAVSTAQQNIRNGNWKAPVPLAMALNFHTAIQRFRAGLDNDIEVHIYSNDVVNDFLSWTGLNLQYERAQRVNRGVGLYTACVIAEMNRLYPVFDENGVYQHDRARDWMVECVSRAFPEEPAIRMNRNTAELLYAKAEAELRAIEADHFGGRRMFDINSAELCDELDDSLHIGRLDSETATRGMMAAMRGLSERALHYFDENRRLRELWKSRTDTPTPLLTPNS